MKEYLDLLRLPLKEGVRKEDRTGTGTLSCFDPQARFDISPDSRGGHKLPLVTTKKIHLKSVIYELLWFMRGETNTKYLTDRGVNIWNKWMDDRGELGPIYGYQWRSWPTPNGRYIDQLQRIVNDLVATPDSRRHIVSAWNVGQLDEMALPPCHAFFQFWVGAEGESGQRKLRCKLYQRSADVFLGVPFNIASYSLLTHMLAQICQLEPERFTHTFGDLHLYLNHVDQANKQLNREPRPTPRIILPDARTIDEFCQCEYKDFEVLDYHPHPKISAPIAV